MIVERGSSYLGHTTPTAGSSKAVKESIEEFLSSNNISTDNIVAVGCNGTNVNTGRVGGVIRLLEEQYEKPEQWLVCQLHANELPLRHLMQHLDGVTSSPQAFAGHIGKQLSSCEHMPIVTFDRIEVELPVITLSDLSTDQRYLWEICNAVSVGKCTLALSRREPGALLHSRWLTTANRILRLYVSSSSSVNLII